MSKPMVPALGAALCLLVAGAAVGQEKAAQAGKVSHLLTEVIEIKHLQPPNMTLKDCLGLLAEMFAAKGKEVPILVDADAFQLENPNTPDIYDTQVSFPRYPKQMTLASALQIALQKLPDKNGAYLIQPGRILITTVQQATPEKQTIHENYSSWVQRLDGASRARLSGVM